ncbi:DUF4255 domain-containing protein [Solitalea canadensis]|uniref:Pvc16 N-terminal domain-containing protein n=1 Tax=Solitalea canadensis (strain ATCC 29591 / DSM 3403 / JCM 21819 / LMG 8368 / NBRC 15130 / NCIMB 12057 / USAM 9D) TaxID=929556 RepID=H8KUA1_SOLCM|nr:DUF4255 domain-containing protein [Solitalea canadensis]AFD07213.1 hypothetical protein Solca_2160 [Solitalea canadensis DSM 3403]
MIFPAVNIIQQELSNELSSFPVTVDLGNITEIVNDLSNGANSDIIISLINIEENRISRELDYYVKKDNTILKKNPAIHLYFTLLFTSVKPTSAYGMSLQNLQHVIEFFQKKFVFDHSNTPALHPNIEKLILEMVTLNLQQLHEIWSVLGGKYYPSVMYRVRMVTIDSITDMEGPPVKEIILNF